MPLPRLVHLSASGVSLVIAQRDDQLPVITHWGRALHAPVSDLVEVFEGERRSGIDGVSDLTYTPSILPEAARGWAGRPGLAVHRAGSAWAPRLQVTRMTVRTPDTDDRDRELSAGESHEARSGHVVVNAADPWAGIEVDVEIVLDAAGLLRTRTTVRNTAPSAEPLEISGVTAALPVPVGAHDMLDFSGRWATERVPQRHRVTHGLHSRESRRGRTGLDATTVIALGTPGFDACTGEVWIGHVGFSGGHEHAVERTDGRQTLRLGELLLPGEVRLGTGEEYVSPWVHGSHGVGIDEASARFHAHLRRVSRAARRPRPVTLNVWEAVYFDQSLEVLTDLAERAADLGVERFVVDDGWFAGRRDDRRGLGDWTADPVIWPEGLGPLADRVRALGMEFGLWVEPEMINEDSDLARAHPDWILRARAELPPQTRFQQVLDLTNPEAFAHILDTLDGLVAQWGVAYLKWDHNRDLVEAGHPATGAPAVHDQTLAVYRLVDELRRRHPDLEIESCASGGGRVDLGILERTDRIHPSDNHDPLDRARILRWSGVLVPPEMLGSHVASPTSSVTGRTHDLHTRCALAFLGHFGIEWDLREADDDERAALARWIGAYRAVRGTIATGAAVTGGGLDAASFSLRGVVAADGSEAVYSVLTPSLSADSSTRVTLPGLHAGRRYRLEVASGSGMGAPWHLPAWLTRAPWLGEGVDTDTAIAGSVLTGIGLDIPHPLPERALVLRAVAVAPAG